ncbi:hypothetical protein [Rhizobium sp. YK2]|uniref:hypothetical protein n=1 Tax=Rhizobium sp. YK2 TaxID=1860096 RepID=UPI00084BE3B1|nr:hypothetical protein [Rhizobium sp. YK2]OEC93382.1 hypothetical protein A9Z06_09445 [Rhizobium sp. YK2]
MRVWAGIDPPAIIIPEGGDDVERSSAGGRSLVQVKSGRAHLGTLPISDACEFIKALWARHDKANPTPVTLELVIERPIAHHETQSDGQILFSRQLANALPDGAKNLALMGKTIIRHVPEANEASIALIAARTGCSPLAAQVCFAQILRQIGKLSDDNGRRQPATYAGMSASDTEVAITDMLAAIDITQMELAVSSGICEPVDFLTPLDDANFYLGVDVQAGHVAAGLVVPRMAPRDALARSLEERGAALIVGPSGAGKSAIMWDAAHALRHTVRWYRLLRLDEQDMPAIRQLLKTLRADPGSPVGFVADDVGRRGPKGWDALTRALAAIPGAIILGSIREEDLFLIEGQSRAVEVRAEPDPDVAQRIFDELKRHGKTELSGWREAWAQSQSLILEYVHILSAGQRFKETLSEQVAAQRRDPGRGTELAALRILSLAGAAGASADAGRLVTTLSASEEDVARGLARLIDEHLVRVADGGQLTGLHQLRSAELVRLTHAVPPPSLGVTFARTVDVVSPNDLEPLISNALLSQGVELTAAIPALVGRLKHDADIDVLSAMLRGLGNAWIAASVEEWLAMPNVRSLVRTQIGTAAMASLLAEPMPALNANIALATAAGRDLAAFRSDASTDPRRSLLDALPADLIGSLVGQTTDAATLNRFLASQIGMSLHPSVHAVLASISFDLLEAPLDAVAELLATLGEIDRTLATLWVDRVGEESLVSRIPREVPWATQVTFDDTPDGRIVRCNYHYIGAPGEEDTHGDVVRICRIAMAFSPGADAVASVARAPNGEPAAVAGLSLAEKTIPRANLPSAALPAWNRRWLDAVAIRIATPSYTEYLSCAEELVEQLVPPLERVIGLMLRDKSVTDAHLSATNKVFEAAQALTPPAVAAAQITGRGSGGFNPYASKLQNLLFFASADLIRRFHKLPGGAGAYAAWMGDLIKSLDELARDEPWDLIGGVPPSLQELRRILVAVRQIAEDVAGGETSPAIKFRKMLQKAQSSSPIRLVASRLSSTAMTARTARAAEVQRALRADGYSAVVHLIEDADAILPWPPSKAAVLISIPSIDQIGEFYQAMARCRELMSEHIRLVAIPLVAGKALLTMALGGYTKMLPSVDEARKWSKQLKLSSSPSRARTTFDRTAAIASSLHSMDRLSLGSEGRPQAEIEKRDQLEAQLTAGVSAIEAILGPLDQQLVGDALVVLDMIRSGEAGYADALHVLSTTGEPDPIIEQLLELQILMELAELDSLKTTGRKDAATLRTPQDGVIR